MLAGFACRREHGQVFSVADVLSITAHRPWELPSGPWIMRQRWSDLLFAHWPVPAEHLRPLVPNALELDTFDGLAYVSVTPFILRIQPRCFPPSRPFPEMNCRTYVRFGGKPGIFFFSLDAASISAVKGARFAYRLPYFHSKMRAASVGEAIAYSSHRSSGKAGFQAEYGPTGPVQLAAPGTLEHWLTERYCLYTVAGRTVYRAEIHHVPWPLQAASCHIVENTVPAAAGIRLPDRPSLVQFVRRLDVLIWPLRRTL